MAEGERRGFVFKGGKLLKVEEIQAQQLMVLC